MASSSRVAVAVPPTPVRRSVRSGHRTRRTVRSSAARDDAYEQQRWSRILGRPCRLVPRDSQPEIGSYGRHARHPGRPGAQPQERQPRAAARPADRLHRAVRLGQVVAGVRHHLRRGPAPLRRVAVGLRPPVPGPDGQARRRLHRGPVAGDLDRPEERVAATPARRSARSPRSTTTCGCCSPASASPHCPEHGVPVTRQTPQQIVDRVLELPEGTRFQVLAPVVRGRKGTYETLLADLAAQGFARAGSTASCTSSADEIELARYEQHTIEVDRRPARPPRRHRAPADRLARDRAQAGRRRGRGPDRPPRRRRPDADGERAAHLQPAPGLPDRRRVLRGAGPPQLLVQLALRRLPSVRRARHPLRGRSRAGRARPRPSARRRRHRPLVRRPAAVLPRLVEAVAEDDGIDLDAPWPS